MESTNNRVIFASGTAFPSFTIPETGETYIPGQGNNMYIFPGLGLGAILSQSRSVSDEMIYSASKALADSLTPEEISSGWLYPSLVRIRDVSTIVATAVIEQAIKEDLCQSQDIQDLSHEELLDYVSSNMWTPSEETYGIVNEKSSI
jgi:malate dehydrogenase (oxaloacetate-decarboxylating)(NADP+)